MIVLVLANGMIESDVGGGDEVVADGAETCGYGGTMGRGGGWTIMENMIMSLLLLCK
jgi:hypothetical protein